MNLSLIRIGLSHFKQHLIQSILLILGVAIGVAVIVSVDLANISANRSFELSTESIIGKTTHRIVGGPSGLDENLYSQLKVQLGLEESAPVVQDYVTVVQLDRRPIQLIGLDPFAEKPFRNYLTDESNGMPLTTLATLLSEPNSILISEELARSSGLRPGTSLTLEYGSRSVNVHIVGLLKPIDDLSRLVLTGLIIADISTAQELLDRTGRLSYIDLIVDSNSDVGKTILGQVEKILPKNARLELPESRTSAIIEINRAFGFNLFALGVLAILVGAFLIYNTITFSVLKRRPILGGLRALGVTTREIFGIIVFESLLLGAIGTVFGLALGIVLGKGILHLITQTINDLYFTITVYNFYIPPITLIKGFFVGISVSFIASLIPALEATRVPPAGMLTRSSLESRIGLYIPWVSIGGLLLIGFGILLLTFPSRSFEVGFSAIFSILLGSALLVPVITNFLMRLFSLVPESIIGLSGRMAPRSVIRTQSRTGIATAALMVAVSVIVSVNIMIGSFRSTVVSWLDHSLTADIFVSLPSKNLSSNEGFDPLIGEEIGKFKSVKSVETARRLTLETPRYGLVDLLVVTEDISQHRRFLWADENKSNIRQRLERGAVLVSEPFAYHNRISKKPGIKIELPTDRGVHTFPVAGIYYDYASQKGIVMMSDSTYRKFWNDNLITSVSAYVAPGYKVDTVIRDIERSFAGRHGLIVQSNRALRLSALRVFDRTFTITSALRLLVGIVAFVGVFSAIMSLQLERMREIGVLRATGMTISQLWRMILLESGLIGMTSGLIAIPVGVSLAYILVYIINVRSFGWTIEFILSPKYLLEALLLPVLAAILASTYPAFSLGRTRITSALRME